MQDDCIGPAFLVEARVASHVFDGARQHRVRVASLTSSGVATVLAMPLRGVRSDHTDVAQAESQNHTMATSLTASLSFDSRGHVRALANAIISTPSGCLLPMPGASDQARTFVMDVASQGFIGLLLGAVVAVQREWVCGVQAILGGGHCSCRQGGDGGSPTRGRKAAAFL